MSGASVWEVIFISLSHSTTLMGKLWLVLLVLLRVLVLLLAGFPLYEDEQERFVCNTIQPGCGNVCYDLFAPVSLFRFWLVQLLCLSLPYLLFLVYVVHRVSHGLACAPPHLPPHPPHPPHPPQEAGRGVGGAAVILQPLWAEPGPWGRCFAGAYLLQLVLRVLLEVGFGAAHYYLFGFAVASRFLCQQPPCTTQVDCYVSRPTEKSAMLAFMLAAAGLSLGVSALDVVAAVKRSVRRSALRRRRRRRRGEKLYDEEHYYLVGGVGGGGFGDGGREDNTNDGASLVHQDVGLAAAVAVAGGASRPGSFRKRGAGGGKASSVTGEPGSVSPGSPVATAPGGPPRSRPPCLNNNNPAAADHSGSCGDAPLGEDDAPPPAEPPPTPRSIRVNKRLKPPPPPRRDHAPSPPPATPTRTPMGSFGDVSKATAAVGGGNRRGGYCGQVAVGGGLDDGQVERSEWV